MKFQPDPFMRWWPVVVRYAGLALVVYETVIDKANRPALYILAAGMMSLPNVINRIANAKGNGK